MANPQPDQFTKISNEIMEVMAKTPLNGTQFRIIFTVLRSTYGFNKKQHELSLVYISKATNIHKQQIKRELDALIKMNVISVIKEAAFNSTRIISFNKNYETWVIKNTDSKQINKQSINSETVSELDYPTVSELDYPTVSELDYQKRKNKESIKKDMSDYEIFFEKIWNLYRKKEGKGSISDTQKKKLFKLGDEIVRAIERYNQKLDKEKTDMQYVKMGSTFFNSGYVDFLDKEYEQKQAPQQQTKEPVKINIIEREF